MSTKTLNLTDSLYEYLLKHSLRESPFLYDLRQKTAALSESRMQISPEQGQFMQLLIELIGAKKTLEIGVFTGYSTLATALALPEDGKIVACDVSEEWTGIALDYWRKAGVAQKIDLRIAPALDTLNQLLADDQMGSFDFAFIDADKANTQQYYEMTLKLLRVGGLLAVDNVLWSGRVADPDQQQPNTKVIRAFNDMLHQDERVTMSLLPIGDGLSLARKRGV